MNYGGVTTMPYNGYTNADDWWDAIGKDKWRELQEIEQENSADPAPGKPLQHEIPNTKHDKGAR